jgi:hypothetical protein
MGNTYGQGEVGDERGSKEMDRCPLTAPALRMPVGLQYLTTLLTMHLAKVTAHPDLKKERA